MENAKKTVQIALALEAAKELMIENMKKKDTQFDSENSDFLKKFLEDLEIKLTKGLDRNPEPDFIKSKK